jgi:hypothetical protein
MRLPSARAALSSAFVVTSVLFLAGCASDDGLRGRRGGPPPKPVIPLAGETLLLDGKLRADVRFGPMQFRKEDTADGRTPVGTGLHGNVNVAGHNGDVRAGGGASYDLGNASIGVGAGPGGMGGGASIGGRGGHGGPRGEGGEHAGRGERGARYAPAFGPLAQLILRFTNTGEQKITFRVADFQSPLGNFVVQPEVFTLEPGQSAAAEPMSTQLGGGVTGVTIAVEVKTTHGSDRQLIELKPPPPEPNR